MQSPNGNPVPNQFIIWDNNNCCYFQSYQSIIIKEDHSNYPKKTYLDKYYWDYSRTTGKYRNIFLGESKEETQTKIDSGEYTLTNLNN